MDTPLFIMHIVDKTSITQKINNYFRSFESSSNVFSSYLQIASL